jgi:phosphoesterase RecJ-like protein
MSGIHNSIWDKLRDLIKDSQSILLSTHINADGDGLGSEIAFYYYLKSLDKDCRIINPTSLPYNYKVIDPDSLVEKYDVDMDQWIEKLDLTIIFDIGDHRRTGEIGNKVYGNCNVVSIDHHPSREDHPFKLNIVDAVSPATGYMIWKYFQYISFANSKLPIKVANALYASVVTDTGSFKYQSTTADTHYMAAHLLECGVDGYDIQRNILETRKMSYIKLMGLVIDTLQYSSHGKVVWTVITQEMIHNAGGTEEDVDGFPEFIRMIEGVEISFMILETSDGSHRISLRSSGNYSINDVANYFDGGGHKFAAGARIHKMTTIDIEKAIRNQLAKKIHEEF